MRRLYRVKPREAAVLLALSLFLTGLAMGRSGVLLAAAQSSGNLELLIRVLPDARLQTSCLVELAGAAPDRAAVQSLADQFQAAGLLVSEGFGGDGWVLNVTAAEPSAEVPGLLADGIVVRCEAQRWGPVTVYRAFMSLGGPDSFMRRLRERLGREGITAAVRLQLPGRVIRTNAPARAGDVLHWDVDTGTQNILLAEATACLVAPLSLLGWVLVLSMLGGMAWLGGDILARSARSRHDLRQ